MSKKYEMSLYFGQGTIFMFAVPLGNTLSVTQSIATGTFGHQDIGMW